MFSPNICNATPSTSDEYSTANNCNLADPVEIFVSSIRSHLPTTTEQFIAKEKDALVSSGLDDLADSLNSFNWQDDVFLSIRMKLVNKDDPWAFREGCFQMKQLLSTSRDEIFNIAQSSLDADLVPPLLDIMKNESLSNDDRLSAAFCITNVLAGTEEQTSQVVQFGALPPLLSLLGSDDHRLRRQAMFAIANVAGNTDNDRMMLAELPTYWSNTIHAIEKANQKKIEELGCWNLRNTCVLGGPTIDHMKPAVLFFVGYLTEEISKEDYGAGYSSLRFATETISCVAKIPRGRELLINLFAERNGRSPSVPTLCVIAARFSQDVHTRSYCLEAAWKILEFINESYDTEQSLIGIIDDMVNRHMISLLTAILKRVGTYTSVNRMYASRLLMLILLRSSPGTAQLASTKMIMPSSRSHERSIPPITECGNYSVDAFQTQGFNSMTDVNPLGYEMSSMMGIKERPTADPMEPSTKTVTGEDLDNAYTLRALHTEVDDASTLESVFRIVNNIDGQQEHWTREAAGRTFIAILYRAPAPFIRLLFHQSVIRCLLDVMEMAHVTETWAKEQAILKAEGWIRDGDFGDRVVPTGGIEKSKEEREYESLSYIRQLTTPSGSMLATQTLCHIKESLDPDIRDELWNGIMDNTELNVLARIRAVVLHSDEYLKLTHLFDADSF